MDRVSATDDGRLTEGYVPTLRCADTMSRGSNQEWPPFDASAFGEPDATSSPQRGAGGTAGSRPAQAADGQRTTDERRGTLSERVARLERRLERRNERIRRLERRLARTEERGDSDGLRARAGRTDVGQVDAVSEPGGDVAADTGSGSHPGVDRSVGVDAVTSRPSGSALRPSLDGVVTRLRDRIEALDEVAVAMLRHYREYGPVRPPDAHAAVGGSGDRVEAYAVNRRLRERGLVAHVGRGHHDYVLASLVDEVAADPLDPDARLSTDERDRVVDAVETVFVDGVEPPSADRDGGPDTGEVGRRRDATASDPTGWSTGHCDDGQRTHAEVGAVGRRSTTWRAVPWPEH